MIDTAAISRRFSALAPFVDERVRRLLAASEALAIGVTGISLVARATGLSRHAIRAGIAELAHGTPTLPPGRIRQPGGGRKPLTAHDPELVQAVERLVEPTTRGNPESPLRWTCKSTRTLADELQRQGHPVSHTKVAQVLHQLHYSLQANRKTREGTGAGRPW
jgi:transposase